MTIYEQLWELSRVSVLAGMHGSGLCNILLMKKDRRSPSFVLEITPWNTFGTHVFFSNLANAMNIHYRTLPVTNRTNALLHTHFLRLNGEDLESVLESGSDTEGSQFFEFWINQDVRVDLTTSTHILQEFLHAINRTRQHY
ncbi:expressed unknown protein [Seminavis robusta]|uniref:Uncharacterized protein n=1 Tax=Seminavis robusta TaxID=568900 RepID=A0A9N8E2K7_9STRA|nr:expressed unknown protein [Seminavis robusta]|eukprot:Sro553_g165390.1 n/a (141) ;mRNA; f:47543-47965